MEKCEAIEKLKALSKRLSDKLDAKQETILRTYSTDRSEDAKTNTSNLQQ